MAAVAAGGLVVVVVVVVVIVEDGSSRRRGGSSSGRTRLERCVGLWDECWVYYRDFLCPEAPRLLGLRFRRI